MSDLLKSRELNKSGYGALNQQRACLKYCLKLKLEDCLPKETAGEMPSKERKLLLQKPLVVNDGLSRNLITGKTPMVSINWAKGGGCFLNFGTRLFGC